MADEIPSAPAAPAATVAPSQAAPAAPVAVTENTNSPSTVETTVASTEVTGSSEQPKVETKPADAPKPDTLLGVEKPVEVKTEEKPTEVKPETIEQPKYEWKLPEGVQVDEAKMGEFDKMLGDFQLSAKIPQEEVQKLGQQMLDRHQAEMQRYTESLTQAWNKQKNDWKESFMKDPEFSNRTNTVLNAAIDVIDTYSGTKEQAQEFRNLMESTGVGNHPAMIRLLANIKLAKPEPKPLAAPLIAKDVKPSKVQKMYGVKS